MIFSFLLKADVLRESLPRPICYSSSTSSLVGTTQRYDIERRFIFRSSKDFQYTLIIESADGYRAQLQNDSLQANILRGVSRFHMDVSDAPLAVFCRRFFINSRNDDIDYTLADTRLVQSRLC